MSGLRYRFDLSRPVGERVSRISVGGEPLAPGRRYTLATRGYLASGGDGYEVLIKATVLVPPANAMTEVTALREWLETDPVFDEQSRAAAE